MPAPNYTTAQSQLALMEQVINEFELSRSLRWILIICALSGSLWGQGQLPTPVQVADASGSFKNNVTTANLIFMGAHSEGALTTPTSSGTATLNSWTLIDSHTGGANAYLWCTTVSSGGTLTTSLAGSISFGGQTTMEYPAFAGITCTKDASANGATTSGTVTTSNITTTQNGDLLVCYMSNFHSSSSVIPSAGSGYYSIMSQDGSDGGGGGYKFAGTNGSYNCVFDGGQDTNAGYIIAAFKPSAITMVTAALPNAALSNTYSFTPQCVGGAGAYTWSVSSGALPTGLSINSSTGAITGTPTGGTNTPTIQCTDGTHTTSAAFTLTVNSTVSSASLISSGGVTTSSNTYSLGTVTSGNCLVIANALVEGEAVVLPTDSLATPFKYVGLKAMPAGVLQFQALYVGQAVASGSDTITAYPSGTASAASIGAQFSNCQNFTDVAAFSNGTNAGTATIAGPSVTTLAPNSLVWGSMAAFTNGTTYTAGSGWTAGPAQAAGLPLGSVYAVESSTGSYAPSLVQSNNTNGSWAAWSLALRPGTSGVVNTNHRRAWVIQVN